MTSGVLIVGGGLAGIAQSIKEASKGRKVLLVEKSESLGGLLKGFKHGEDEFPIGAHFLRRFNDERVNRVLFDNLTWLDFRYLRAGHFVNNHLDTSSPFININNLPLFTKVSCYKSVLKSLIFGPVTTGESQLVDAGSLIESVYGKRVRLLFERLSLKYFGTPLSQLKRCSLDPLVISSRVKIFNPWISRVLKKLMRADAILSYHSYREGSTEYASFVPRNLKYTQWWSTVRKRLESLGIEVHTSSHISIDGKEIIVDGPQKLRLCANEWDIQDCAGWSNTSDKLSSSVTVIRFLKVTNRVSIDCHYITSYCDLTPFTRLTFMENIGGGFNGLVLEDVFFDDQGIKQIASLESVSKALIEMNLYSSDTKFSLAGEIKLIGKGFRPSFLKNTSDSSPSSLGIAGGVNWFMNSHV